MAAGGTLLVILVLTSVNAMLAGEPNSLNHALICEDATKNLTRCVNYPAGIMNITNVEFPEDNEHVCSNNRSSKCLASEEHERKLTSILGKICNGKRYCKVHLSHGIYKGMELPCRGLNMRIRIGIFYDCLYSPKSFGTIDKQTHSTEKPSTTESPTVSLSMLPSSISTSTTVEEWTDVIKGTTAGGTTTTETPNSDVIKGTTAGETTATETPNSNTVWKRRRPKSCNLKIDIDEDETEFPSSGPRIIVSFSCLVAQVLYLFIFLP